MREVERFVPGDLGPLSDARQLLAECAHSASGFGMNPGMTDERAWQADERERFTRFVVEIGKDDLLGEPPRPYRRTLSDHEVDSWC